MPTIDELRASTIVTGNYWLDALLSEQGRANLNWMQPQSDVYIYTFDAGKDVGFEEGATLLPQSTLFSAQKNAIRIAIEYISGLTGIKFVEGTAANADLFFANSDITAQNSTAFFDAHNSYSYNPATNVVTRFFIEGYIYFDIAEFAFRNVDPQPGTRGYETILHELGHALGLKHSFAGAITLPTVEDNSTNTLMSYQRTDVIATAYAPYDLAALAYLYGGDGVGGKYGYGTGTNVVLGTGVSETIKGSEKNDIIKPLRGDDVVLAGAGLDRVYINALVDGAKISQNPVSGELVVGSAADGTDVLNGVERLIFNDVGKAFDLSGNAGLTAKILGGVFGPESVANKTYAGIGLSYLDGGWTYEQLMILALNARLGADASHEAVVNLLYFNLTGVQADMNTRNHFVSLLDSKTYSVLQLAKLAAETPENAININLTGLAVTGLDYIPYG